MWKQIRIILVFALLGCAGPCVAQEQKAAQGKKPAGETTGAQGAIQARPGETAREKKSAPEAQAGPQQKTGEGKQDAGPEQANPPDLPAPPVVEPATDLEEIAGRLTAETRDLLTKPFQAMPAPPPGTVIRGILGFVLFLALAYVAGHSAVKRWERSLNIAHAVTAGLPFVMLGVLASQPAVGILTPTTLSGIAPLLTLGLGWVGFGIGSRFDARFFERLPPNTGAAVILTTVIPLAFLMLVGSLFLQFVGTGALDGQPPHALREGLLLATAGAMAARSAPHFLRAFTPGAADSPRMEWVIELEQLAGVFGTMFVSTFFRPQQGAVAWQLPGTAWLFVLFGVGMIMGIVVLATLTRVQKGAQFTVALLGAISLTAGMASYLRLSAIAVCFLAGAIVFNMGGKWRMEVRAVLDRLERPIYFLFLVVAGALWRPWEWQGWAFMALFVLGRFVSKWAAAATLGRFWMTDMSEHERRVLIASPMGALSVAVVVLAQDLYSGPFVGWSVTAVIGGSIVMEIALQIALRRKAREQAEAVE